MVLGCQEYAMHFEHDNTRRPPCTKQTLQISLPFPFLEPFALQRASNPQLKLDCLFSQMSVIGEAVAGVAVAASFTQLLAHILSTTRTLKGFYENMQNAPSELSHVVQKLNLVYDNLKVLESILLKSATFDEIAPNLQSLLRDTMGVVDRAVYDMKNQCLVKSMNAIKSRGSRFRYAWSGHDDVTKHLQRLRDAETSLSHTCQLLTMCVSHMMPSINSHNTIGIFLLLYIRNYSFPTRGGNLNIHTRASQLSRRSRNLQRQGIQILDNNLLNNK